MKTLGTKQFNEKLGLTPQAFQLKFLEYLEAGIDIKSLLKYSHTSYDNVYVMRIDNYRIFYSIEEDKENNNIVLFLDLINRSNSPVNISSKNPKLNNSINPRLNNSINPRMNNSINPRINNSINPRMNNSINPRMNNSINPRMNNSINPRMNNSINPRMNNSINPRMNNLINPKYNPNINGYYVYDLDNNLLKYCVRPTTKDRILLIFNYNSNDFCGFAVKHMQNGFVVFDIKNLDWIEHYESDGQNGFNVFDLNNEWIGHIK